VLYYFPNITGGFPDCDIKTLSCDHHNYDNTEIDMVTRLSAAAYYYLSLVYYYYYYDKAFRVMLQAGDRVVA